MQFHIPTFQQLHVRNVNSRKERQFRFSVELANIGSIGNNMGQDANQRQALYGFR